jgi:hypothetical protein
LRHPDESRRLDVGSLLAFRALRDFKLDFLTFFQGLEAIHLDCGKVSEQILTTVIRSNKAKALGVIEPLDGTCCHKKRLSNLDLITRAAKKEASSNVAPPKNCSILINKQVLLRLSMRFILYVKNINVKIFS